jgi:hypothetical protein
MEVIEMGKAAKRTMVGIMLLAGSMLTSCGSDPVGACVDDVYNSDFGTSTTVCSDGVDVGQCDAHFYENKTCADLGIQSCPTLAGLLGACSTD